MRIDGRWAVFEDGGLRPAIDVSALGVGGRWHPLRFVLDTGADRTILCYDALIDLGLEVSSPDGFRVEGAGGEVGAGVVPTDLRLVRETGAGVLFRGPFSALTDPAALNLNLLGRDVLSRFAVIVDRPADVVCLLTGRHRYVIQES